MNNLRKLHIVCHDVPYPPDYGGVFDLFYKIKALHEEGIIIKLHCFSYGRPKQTELNKYCGEVNYYERKTGLKGFSFTRPYIVHSRANPELLENLLKDNYPVLMEGVHCTAFLPQVMNKKKAILRLHNVEGKYYWELFKSETSLFKKSFFLSESTALSKYEKKLPDDLLIITVSERDAYYYKNDLGKQNVKFLPVFIPFSEITAEEGMGNYCLYHGNLGVPENNKAAIWLLNNVFSKIKVPFVIAGKNPSKRLIKLANAHKNANLVANPPDIEMTDLIKKAHINILPSFNSTGIKLKLVHALFKGKHCVVNEAAVEGSGVESACYIGNTARAMVSIIAELYNRPFTEDEINIRSRLLPSLFNNKINAQQLIQWIW